MSFAKSPLRRGLNGRATHTRFVEVEMPAVGAGHLLVELEGCQGEAIEPEPALRRVWRRKMKSGGDEPLWGAQTNY